MKHAAQNIIGVLVVTGTLLGTGPSAAAPLVSPETVEVQKSLTTVHKLKNGIPVVIRSIPDSDIVQVNVGFNVGLRDLPPGRKVLNEWYWTVASMAAEGYPKDKVFALTSKYSLELGCQGGIESSSCGLGTLNDYWSESLPLLAAVVAQPSLTSEDAKLVRERLVAKLKSMPTDPGQYVNEVVNRIFYPVGHPFRLNHNEALAELEKLTDADLRVFRDEVISSDRMHIVVVTSMPEKKVIADLDKAFGGIGVRNFKSTVAKDPVFDLKQSYEFEDRDIPTAYIRIKLNAPPVTDKDAMAVRLLYEILSEELGEEIRTKRSLSYAVHSFVLQYSVGIGVISVTTSKPKETLEALQDVLNAIKSKEYKPDELEEYKNVFATSYFMTQETHASLASAISGSMLYWNNPFEVYDAPRKLAAVTAADVKRLAGSLLSDFRMGVIFGKDNFKHEWAEQFIRRNVAAAAEKKSH